MIWGAAPEWAPRRGWRPPVGPSRAERDVVVVIAALATVAAGFSSGEPTGVAWADVLFRGALAAAVVLLTARARRWTWLVLAGGATVAAEGAGLVAVAAGSLVLAAIGSLGPRHVRPVGAAVAALGIQVLLRLPDTEPALWTAFLTVAITGPAAVSGWSALRGRSKRHVRIGLALITGLTVVGALLLGLTVLGAQDDVRTGVAHVRAGFSAAGEGDSDAAAVEFEAAAQDLTRADDSIGAWWAAPARVLPGLGPQARALQAISTEGIALAESASAAGTNADIDGLQLDDGALDLELVADLEGPLNDVADTLAHAVGEAERIDSPWLLPPLQDRLDDFRLAVEQALPAAALAAEGVAVTPALFGADGARHYLVLFVQPAEARGLGGFLGSYGELTVTDGDVELTRSGPISDLLEAPGERELTGPPDYLARYGRFEVERFLQDIPLSPDFPNVAEVAAELYPQAGGRDVDGVISVDPVALGALMEFTGPVEIEGLEQELTPENAADVLMREQYLLFGDDESERKDFLAAATEEVFQRLTEADLPGPRQLADVLGPVVDEGRLMMHSFEPAEQAFLEQAGLDGAFPAGDGGDLLSVITQNVANNKIDSFLDRTVEDRIVFEPGDGRVEATVTIRLTNRAPASGLPDAVIGSSESRDVPPGTNLQQVTVHTPLTLTGATVDGRDAEMLTEREFGVLTHTDLVEIPPGETLTVELTLTGFIAPSDSYRLRLAPQPLVNADRWIISVSGASGWQVTSPTSALTGDGSARLAVTPRTDRELEFRLRRD